MQENIINELMDEALVAQYLATRLPGHYPGAISAELESIKAIKKQIWLTTYHVVLRYKVRILLATGKELQKIIFVTAHDHEPRRQVLETLHYLVANGFGQGQLLVPKPLFYDERYNASFYEGVIGENLYAYIKDGDREVIDVMLELTAKWFAKLHRLKPSGDVFLTNRNGRIETLSPGVETIISLIEERYPEHLPDYQMLYRTVIDRENRYFATHKRREAVHGDAHPENVIRVAANKVALIDFVDMSLGDRARDLGCFLQQLDFMVGRKIADPEYVRVIKERFLTSYLKHAKIKATKQLAARIETYYWFTAIRTATFFFLKHDPEPERALPLLKAAKAGLSL